MSDMQGWSVHAREKQALNHVRFIDT